VNDRHGKRETDWERFKRIHREKPAIYKEFCRVTKVLRDRGYPRYSAYGVMHIVRFHSYKPGVDMRPDEEFKISNNMTPFYARLYIRDHPDHVGFFKIKRKYAGFGNIDYFQEEWIKQIPRSVK